MQPPFSPVPEYHRARLFAFHPVTQLTHVIIDRMGRMREYQVEVARSVWDVPSVEALPCLVVDIEDIFRDKDHWIPRCSDIVHAYRATGPQESFFLCVTCQPDRTPDDLLESARFLAQCIV